MQNDFPDGAKVEVCDIGRRSRWYRATVLNLARIDENDCADAWECEIDRSGNRGCWDREHIRQRKQALNWRASQRMRFTFLVDDDPRRSVILFRSLNGMWLWAIRDMLTEPMAILCEGGHRRRVTAAQQAEQAYWRIV